jgi:hypothetical protein
MRVSVWPRSRIFVLASTYSWGSLGSTTVEIAHGVAEANATDPTPAAVTAATKGKHSTSKVQWKTRREGLEEIHIMMPVASLNNAGGVLNEASDADADSLVSTLAS